MSDLSDLKEFDLIEIQTKKTKFIHYVVKYYTDTKALSCITLKGSSATYVNCKFPVILLGNIKDLITCLITDNLKHNSMDERDYKAMNKDSQLPIKKVVFFKLKDEKYMTDNNIEITTEMLIKYPHQITDAWSFIVLD